MTYFQRQIPLEYFSIRAKYKTTYTLLHNSQGWGGATEDMLGVNFCQKSDRERNENNLMDHTFQYGLKHESSGC